MHGRASREEDSDSDWDSISEMAPPPSLKQESQNSFLGQSQSQPAVVPRKLKSMTYNDPQLESKHASENPPFNFKVSNAHPSKPGKQKKGNVYDPRPSSQRRVSFVGDDAFDQDKSSVNGNMTGPDSDAEDPLYSSVKPKHVSVDSKKQQESEEQPRKKDENSNKSEKKISKVRSKLSHKKLQGFDNKGFLDDQATVTQHVLADAVVKKQNDASPLNPKPQALINQQPPSKLPQDHDTCEQGLKHDASHITSNTDKSVLFSREWSPPLILSIGETSLQFAGKKPLEAINRVMGEVFAMVTFPFSCFTLFIHHLLRFFVLGVVRPLLVDTLTLMVEYLVRPFMSGVVRPLLVSLHGISMNLSDTLVVCVRPIVAVLQSFRLVEVNYTRKYSVEEI
ncbi:hypothetical protein Hamer_G002351 [Homarus americanus]|uniref:Uncharacterized protein n=1 Tax=Homarus americanus TaxID=6706 RepID=A0A8J5K2C6_HOMAM|nr:hypothetical protein Hamer_G002351 [Homarus americanus]